MLIFEYREGEGKMATKPKAPVAVTFYKQPWETYLVGADFSWVIDEGEEIVLATSDIVAEDVNGTDASSDVLDNSAKAVSTADADDITTTPVTNAMLVTRIKDGTVALSKYLITYRAITDLGNQYELDLKMSIKEPSV